MNFTARSKSGKELKVEAKINDDFKPEYRLPDSPRKRPRLARNQGGELRFLKKGERK